MVTAMTKLGIRWSRPRPRAAARVDKDTPIRDAPYVVVDTELTGLDEKVDRVVSIGAFRMREGRIILGDAFYMLANPETAMRRESVVVHGITPSEVDEKPSLDEVVYEFHRYIGGDILVGHCMTIDLGFINKELMRIIGYTARNAAVDTLLLHEWLLKKLPAYRERASREREAGLYSIAKVFDIPSFGAHNAEVDAYITAQVFQRFIPMLTDAGVKTVGDLLRIGDPYKGGDKYRNSGVISNF
jgi:DNA polymerase-3 subunit epsilon